MIDCLFLEDAERYPNKWVADPRRCPDDALWLTHSIIGLPGKAAAASDKLKPTTAEFEFRHCRQISTDWKYDRARLPVIGGRMRYDRPLAQALMTAFPERHIFRSSGGLVGRTIDFLRQN